MRTLEVELNKSPYKDLAAVHEALLYWNDDWSGDYGYANIFETRGKRAMTELVLFMGRLPGRYHYDSVDEYILGYERAGGELSRLEIEALKQWNAMLRRALSLGTEMAGKLVETDRAAVQALLEDVCEFSMGRHERAMKTLSARLESKGKGIWEASVPFLAVGEGAEREALVEVVGPEV